MITAEKEQTVLEAFRRAMAKREHVVAGSPLFAQFHQYSQEALQITMELNNKYLKNSQKRALYNIVWNGKRWAEEVNTDSKKNLLAKVG